MDRFDNLVDSFWEPMRGRPTAEAGAALLCDLSNLGLVWLLLARLSANDPGERWKGRRLTTSAVAISDLASRAVERATRSRLSRPMIGPSLTASCAAVLLGRERSNRSFATTAILVAAAQTYLGRQRASNVIVGSAMGGVLGLILARVFGTPNTAQE